MTNFELKITLDTDSIKGIENLLKKMGASYRQSMHQIDHYINTGTFKEKIREIDGKEIQKIVYHRDELEGRKESKYSVEIISKREKSDILKRNKVLCKVEKDRELWIYKNTRIHLDYVTNLGNFLELETVIKNTPTQKGIGEFNKVVKLLKINTQNTVPYSYSDLILKKQQTSFSLNLRAKRFVVA